MLSKYPTDGILGERSLGVSVGKFVVAPMLIVLTYGG